MKNSAWYHKLLRQKLDEQPIEKEAATAWGDMQNMLNEHLPVSNGHAGGSGYNGVGSNLTTLLSYIIPVAAVIGALGYFIVHKQTTTNAKQKHTSHVIINKDTAANNNSDNSTVNYSSVKSNRVDTGINNTAAGQAYNANAVADKSNNADNTKMIPPSTNLATNNLPRAAKNSGVVSGSPKNNLTSTINRNLPVASNTHIDLTNKSPQNNLKAKASNPANSVHNNGIKQGISIHHRGALSTGNTINSGSRIALNRRNSRANSIALSNTHHRRHALSSHSKPIGLFSSNTTAQNNKPRSTGNAQTTTNNPDSSKVLTTESTQKSNNQTGTDTALQNAINNQPLNSGVSLINPSDTGKNKNNKPTRSATKKSDSTKSAKAKPTKPKTTGPFSYGVEAGFNLSNSGKGYFGAFGTYAISTRWQINAGARINSTYALSGQISHDSYYRPDSLPPFKIADSRSLLVLSIPLNVEFKLLKWVSFKAGPVLNYTLKRSNTSTQLGVVPNVRDTLGHTSAINAAISSTTINKVNVGFAGSIDLFWQRFYLEGRYFTATSYLITNPLGSYNTSSNTFQLGIGYRFK